MDCQSQVQMERLANEASDEIFQFFVKVKESITRYEGFSTNTALFFLIKMIYSMLIDADRLDAYNFNTDEKQETETTILNSLDRFYANYEEHLKPLQNAPTNSESEKRIQELRYIISEDCVRAVSYTHLDVYKRQEYDTYKGVILHVAIRDGRLEVGDEIYTMNTKKTFTVTELGYFSPGAPFSTKSLEHGDVGYIVAAIKNVKDIGVGDTVTLNEKRASEALPGYKPCLLYTSRCV